MYSISTVTPVYAGQDYLPDLVAQLDALRSELADRGGNLQLAEAIFVVDGAVDDSERILTGLAADRPWLRPVVLSRNFGQHNATVAGILHSSGDWVVTLDEDLQHPPRCIPELLAEALAHHADVVLAVPRAASHGNSYRDRLSKLAKRLVALASRNEFVPQFSSFRLIRGQLARAAASVCSHQTYFDVALVWFTSRIRSWPLELHDRRFAETGASGYSFTRLLSHAKRLLLSSDVQFFKLTLLISGSAFLAAVVLEGWVLTSYFFTALTASARGWASLMSVILLFGAVGALLLGLVLEVVRMNMFHGQGKPSFFVIDRSSDDALVGEVAALLADRDERGDSDGGV